jgi:hypothetical protein
MCLSTSTTYCLPILTFQLAREILGLVITDDYREETGKAMTHMFAAETHSSPHHKNLNSFIYFPHLKST